MNARKLLFGLLLLLALPATGAAGLVVNHAWIRLLPGSLPLAGYMDIANTGPVMLALTDASSPEFRRIQIHRSLDRGGIEEMQRVPSLDIGPGQTARLAPDGYHLMLIGRRKPLHVGDRVPVTLVFSDHERVLMEFRVRGATG